MPPKGYRDMPLSPDPTRHAWADRVLSKGSIPFKGGRPERDVIINDDDICNLKIALGTAQSLNEFLEVV
ncbi:MAG: hypothetical protein GF334_08990 [Candidatus Altiarchaeales archaeon]|nr:hypothetical protein [Candidatus Altiarchaeales archaeon]